MQRSIFTEILEGKIPSHKVYEDDLFYAFLDVFPRSIGHTLVIPKKQARWVYEVPEFGAYWEVVHKITQGIQKGLMPVWVSYLTFGLEVPHAHIHILPRFTAIDVTVPAYPDPIKMTDDELKRTAEKIREGMKQ